MGDYAPLFLYDPDDDVGLAHTNFTRSPYATEQFKSDWPNLEPDKMPTLDMSTNSQLEAQVRYRQYAFGVFSFLVLWILGYLGFVVDTPSVAPESTIATVIKFVLPDALYFLVDRLFSEQAASGLLRISYAGIAIAYVISNGLEHRIATDARMSWAKLLAELRHH